MRRLRRSGAFLGQRVQGDRAEGFAEAVGDPLISVRLDDLVSEKAPAAADLRSLDSVD
jgi:hypothetical protein